MGKINFADGASVTFRVKRTARQVYKSSVSFPSYGGVPVTPGQSDAWLGRVEVVAPPSGLTSITNATSPGGRARVRPRSDGNITVDMLDAGSDASDLTLTLTGTRNSQTSVENMTLTVIPRQESHGQGKGIHPALRMDGTDVVYYPSIEHRKVYVSTDGYTQAEIEAREAWSAIGTNLRDNTALAQGAPGKGYNPGGVYKYGETPELALDANRARQLILNGWGDTDQPRLRTVEVAFRKGDDFSGASAMGGARLVGRGPLHPSIIRAYGEDEDANVTATARPVHGGLMSNASDASAANWVHSAMTISGAETTVTGTPYLSLANIIYRDGNLGMRSAGGPNWGLTVQYYSAQRSVADNPSLDAGGKHKLKQNHKTAIYVSSGHSTLVWNSFMFHTGWEPGYDIDYDGAFPDPPEQWSQNGYFSSGGFNVDDAERVGLSKDITIFNMISTEAAANDLQLRPGGVCQASFFGRGNTGPLFGGGPDLSLTLKDGNYTYAWGIVRSGQGYKTLNGGKSPSTGTGVSIGGISSVLDEVIVANIGDLHPPAIAHTQFASNSPAIKIQSDSGEARTPRYRESVVYNWTTSANENPNSVSTADLAKISPTTWMDEQFPANAPHTWEDFNDYCEAHENPWEIGLEYVSWARDLAGYDETPRAAAASFRFEPHATIPTPGCRWDIYRDWNGGFTGKLVHNQPGAVSGLTDNVDLDGHRVYNYLTLEPLNSFDFGTDGHLIQTGGYLEITGAISGTGTLETYMRGIVALDGSAHDLTDIAVTCAARLENRGTLTGVTDYDVQGYGEFLVGVDGASFTLPSGATLTLDGPLARGGWDGGAGGTSTADFQAGSTISIKPGLSLPFTGFVADGGIFVPGSTVTGATSGATARIVNFWYFDNSGQTAGTVFLDSVSGTFQAGESITGSKYDTFSVLTGQTLFAAGTPTVMCPYIKKECFGGFGAGDPSVAANVTLGGAWEIDVTNLGTGTFNLMDGCDSVTGTPSGYTVTGLGGSRDATLTIETDGVNLVLAAGTGVTNAIQDNR